MDYIQTIAMGFIQGLSEFLPISSSAHLVFVSAIYKLLTGVEISLHSSEEIILDIMLHLGTLVAVVLYFRKKLLCILKSIFISCKTHNFQKPYTKLAMYIFLGTCVSVFVGFFIKDYVEKVLFRPDVVGILLIGTGILLLYTENYIKFREKNSLKPKRKFSFLSVLFISTMQGLAALPGLSRSGLTIAAGIFSNHSRVRAAEFSFLLSIPIILGASLVYPFLELNLPQLADFNWMSILAGTFVSAVSGYFCIKYFLKFLKNFSLVVFGYYCLIVGIITSIFFRFFILS